MKRFYIFILWVAASALQICKADTIPTNQLQVIDCVQYTPLQGEPVSNFLNPEFTKSYGYKTQAYYISAQFGINWQTYDATIFPKGSAGRIWVDNMNDSLHHKYSQAKAAGMQVYCWMDMLVLPKTLVTKYKDSLTTNGKIDINRPFTQLVFKALIKQIFDEFPELDGLIIRTGETYLWDQPYHQGNSPVINGLHDHIPLINLLRQSACVQRNKIILYRTWDFGQFHSLPKDYLYVTDSIEPHKNLYFSIKHTIVDFWRNGIPDPSLNYSNYNDYWQDDASVHGVYFNPTLGIGKHKQIVEVQCQREYEGKSSSPDYIAKGVIDGFAELKKPGLPALNSLNAFRNDEHFAGIWTWSRGGGWGGPYNIKNELWSELNAYVVAQWAKDPTRKEEDIFNDFALMQGLPKNELKTFRQICLLSDQGVMRGQYSNMGGVNVVWTRDDNFAGQSSQTSYFKKILKDGKVDDYLKEKQQALDIWLKIEALSQQLHFKTDSLTKFTQLTCTYGRYKYQLFNAAWDIMLRGYVGDQNDTISELQMKKDITTYDSTLAQWQAFVKKNKNNSPSVYDASQFTSTVDKYRNYHYKDILISFTGSSANNQTTLNWLTARMYHKGFAVQRSVDNTTWIQIAKVAGTDTTYQANAYQYIDTKPQGAVNYYRIILVDTAGKLNVSASIKIAAASISAHQNITAQALNTFKVIVTPNPVLHNAVSFFINNEKDAIQSAFIIDAAGKTIAVKSLQAKGNSFYGASFVYKLTAGVYTLVVNSKNGFNGSARFIVQ